MSDSVFAAMSKRDQDVAMLSLWNSAYRRAPRKYLTEEQRMELVRDVSDQCGLPGLTFRALSQRVSRIQERGTLERAPGSGRPRTFAEEHASAARQAARAFGGEISRTGIYELVAEQFGSENVNKRTQFLRWLSEIFKRRRIRCKPSLNDTQKVQRVAYAQNAVDTEFSEDVRTIFVDEKRFEASAAGIYNLPVEDSTPTRKMQSKSNPVFVMVLVAIMAPRRNWNGVIGSHAFVERVAAAKKSKNREAGTMELHAINATKETYVGAWIRSIFPAIQRKIEEGKLLKPTKKLRLLIQDDNAKAHRGLYKDGMTTIEFICMEAEKQGLFLAPRYPAQPPQSPDLNPLDTFLFRVLAMKWRRLRARDRVQRLAASRAPSYASVQGGPNHAVRRLDLDDVDVEHESEGEDEIPLSQRTVPLRCKPEGTRKRALCAGCGFPVKETDKTAVQCELRFGWWHLSCVKELIGAELYPRAVTPDLKSADVWICPQCSMHLCRNDDRTSNLCLICWKPSQRNGNDMGGDMICCDNGGGGLFHKKCVNYNEEDAAQVENWFCSACDTLVGDEDVALEDLESRPISGNNVDALLKAVELSFDEVPYESFVRGFETRRMFIQRVLESKGDNNYEMHWRREARND